MAIPFRYSVRSLLARKTRSLLTALGVAVVVFIAVMMMGLSQGLLATATGSASSDNILVLSYGAETMEFSAIEPSDFHAFAHAHTIKRYDGEPLASPEVFLGAFVNIPEHGVTDKSRGVIRGVRPVALSVHEAIKLIEGALPSEGFNVMVGALAATKLGVPESFLQVGRDIEFEGQTWKIAGIFEAPGTLYETEIWAHLDDVMTASRRRDYSVITIKTPGVDQMQDLLFDLSTRTDVRVRAVSEEDYYAATANTLRPISLVTQAITAILVLGGIMAGMNTMFTSVVSRSRDMAILMVRGHKRSEILMAFLLESILLCMAGGVIGCMAGLLLNDLPMRMPMSAFRFVVDASTITTGLSLAAFIGIVGALIPLARVMRRPIIEGLRSE